MASFLQQEILKALPIIMRPIVRFLLRYGVGYREFATLCKAVFIEIASAEYGLRGRPTNLSRVAAMTGISRKEVSSSRSMIEKLTSMPSLTTELNPPTVVLHFWHSDPDFSDAGHVARPLRFAGFNSFSELVRRYAGDIPPGAIRAELKRSGAIQEQADGSLVATRSHYTPLDVDAEFVRSMAFSLANLANTLVSNAVYPLKPASGGIGEGGRLERYVWTSRLPTERVADFKALASEKAGEMLAELDKWIGDHETKGPEPDGEADDALMTGMGVYYFEGDSDREVVRTDGASSAPQS